MISLKNHRKIFFGLLFLISSGNVFAIQESFINVCLTGRIEQNLPAYKKLFTSAAYLALHNSDIYKKIQIKTYFYNNQALAPLEEYKKMRTENCQAIIGFEYLSDLLLVAKAQLSTPQI